MTRFEDFILNDYERLYVIKLIKYLEDLKKQLNTLDGLQGQNVVEFKSKYDFRLGEINKINYIISVLQGQLNNIYKEEKDGGK